MNKHLQRRVEELLARHDTAILATCGSAGPQVSRVPYRLSASDLLLFVPQGCDHLFNLETRHDLALLAPEWQLHGEGHILQVEPLRVWQVCVKVQLLRFHILNAEGSGYIETIDFEQR